MKRFLFSLATLSLLSLTPTTSQTTTPLTQYNSTRITGGDMKALERTDVNFVLSIDEDRLLYFFRAQAGLSNPAGVSAYGGWESSDLRGHTLGHWLSAMSLLYAQTGDEAVLARIVYTVSVLRQAQQAMGTGYIGAFGDGALTQVENDGSGWAPYYTMHKILQGLVDAAVFTGDATALEAATDLGDYFYRRTLRLTDEAAWQRNLDIMEVGGFAEAMLNLYRLTGNEHHLTTGHFFQQMDKLLPSAQGQDILADSRTENFHHANATIPQFIAAEREYELTGDATLLAAACNFWENVTGHRAYCNGSTGYHEHWNLPPDRLSQEMDIKAGETCCTYNLIRLSNDLFRLLREPKYAEYVERATLNHIMGSINPVNSNFMYFHTQRPGSYKSYGRNTEVFWCCTGSGMENHVRYGQAVFFGQADTLYVCQYFPSQLFWEEKGLTIQQETDFPNEEHTRLVLSGTAAHAVLKVRIPTWSDGFAVRVNGAEAEATTEGGFCCIDRTWSDGDVVDINLPMYLRIEPLADSPRQATICYGPLVLAGDFGNEGLTDNLINVTDNYYNDSYPAALTQRIDVPVLTGSMERLDWIEKVEGKMEFTTSATSDGTTLRLIPLYKAFGMRFADYWKFQGDLTAQPIAYPAKKSGAEPVTQLEDGVEYAMQNANASLPNRNFYWDWINLRTRSTGNIDDVRFRARRVEEDGHTYWSFQITSDANSGRWLGRTNTANAQVDNERLWTATYVESQGEEGSGFVLLLKGDNPGEGHEMMMNGDGTWVVTFTEKNKQDDKTPHTSHWQFFRTADLDPAAMQTYNDANLRLYQYLKEASQMYDRGITAIVEPYNSGVAVYTDPANTVGQLTAATEDLQNAIASTVSLYTVDEPAAYGILNPGFENLSAQNDHEANSGVQPPFGWTLTRNGTEVKSDDNYWYWASINADGGYYMEGGHIYGVWNGSNYGEMELSQTLTDLPNGRWRLTALVMNNHAEAGNLARLFLNNNSMLAGSADDYAALPEGEDCTFSGEWSTADNDMHQRFQVESDVTDGTLTFGIRSNGFFKADDFRLTLLERTTGVGERPPFSPLPGKEPEVGFQASFDLSGRPIVNCKSVNRKLSKSLYINNKKKIIISN